MRPPRRPCQRGKRPRLRTARTRPRIPWPPGIGACPEISGRSFVRAPLQLLRQPWLASQRSSRQLHPRTGGALALALRSRVGASCVRPCNFYCSHGMRHSARRASCILALEEGLRFSAIRCSLGRVVALLCQPPEDKDDLRGICVRVESIDEVLQGLNVAHEFFRSPRLRVRLLYLLPFLG
ncbi:hypothetical protein Ctob_013698 [Chrysochromulina tobinii]|uniref:Uncharacterized protein n=1 Tax=Chrysochromulina tobinii TaxID=1460289 RepID=A0A0M0K404_9EUKA|nr:hypothetical protein Ctob_013698 [Chrysochromulina tobinii]|eukprot:KOO33113.1 hypothetical protein Ctob_013698 [Chrysochromulina sp. CCMP291]